MTLPRKIIMVGLVLVLAACSRDRDTTLTRFQNKGDGPDEFSIVPGKPLQEPESYASLPTPEPGAPNRTDQTPLADGIAALGGNAAATASAGIAPGDAGLVRHAARHGTDPAIRQTLRVEDDKIRRNYGRRNLLRIGPRDDYTQAYKRQWLDEQAERERLRRAGVVTPTAPPPTSR
ncbi:MAG: DUF3035 domain-containing protein [Roseovarius sp.]|nr:DUF3035 domain-containing protein [Roseovarius sp.]